MHHLCNLRVGFTGGIFSDEPRIPNALTAVQSLRHVSLDNMKEISLRLLEGLGGLASLYIGMELESLMTCDLSICQNLGYSQLPQAMNSNGR